MSLATLARRTRDRKSAAAKARAEKHQPDEELEEDEDETADTEEREEVEDDEDETTAEDDREDEEAEDENDDPSAEDGDEDEGREACAARRRERRRMARVMGHKAARGREQMAITLVTTTGLSSRKIVNLLNTAPKADGGGFLAAMDRVGDRAGNPRPGVGRGDGNPDADHGWGRIVARINKRR